MHEFYLVITLFSSGKKKKVVDKSYTSDCFLTSGFITGQVAVMYH